MPSRNDKPNDPRRDESIDFGAFVEQNVQRTSDALKGETSSAAPPPRPGGERKVDRARDQSYWRKKAADAGIPTDIEDDAPPPPPRRNRYLAPPEEEYDEFHDEHEFDDNGGGFGETVNHYFNGDDGNRNRIIAAILIVLLVLAIIWGLFRLFSGGDGGDAVPTPTPTEVISIPPTSTPGPDQEQTPPVTQPATEEPEIKRGGDNQRGDSPGPSETEVAQIDITNDIARACTGLCLIRVDGSDQEEAFAEAGARASWTNGAVSWVVVNPTQAQMLSESLTVSLVENDPRTYNLYVVVAPNDRNQASDITPHGDIVDQGDGVYLVRWGWVPAVVKPVTDWGYAVYKIAPAPPEFIAEIGVNGPARNVTGWDLMEQVNTGNIERITDDLVHIGEMDDSGWGTRYYEFAGNQIAADYLYQELESYGMTVWYEDFITWDGYLLVNVVAEIPGTDGSEIYAIMAHFDTINLDNPRIAPGADDNASGIAVTLETVRILSGYELNHPVRVSFVNAEEVGILGSSAWARQANSDGAPIAGVFNVDSVASVRNRPVLITNVDAGSQWMQDHMNRINANYELREDMTNRQSEAIVADDNMVRAEGIPAIMIARELYGQSEFHHTADDIPANFSIGAIADTTNIVMLSVWELVK